VSRKKKKKGQDSKLVFPWEAKEGKGGGTSDPTPAPIPVDGQSPDGEHFPGESTREYRLEDTFEAPAARSEITMDSPRAREETRQVVMPVAASRQRPSKPVEYDEKEWPAANTVGDRFRRKFYADPVVHWFMSLPRERRQVLARAAWILGACWLIIGIFMWSSMVIYPMLEGHLRPSFAPKPGKQVRKHPRQGKVFDLAEERTYDARKFKMGIDCLWVTKDPASRQDIVPGGVSLVYGNEIVATLDMRVNWDGLLRFYFGVGDLIPNSPMYVRIPIVDGGMWLEDKRAGYKLLSAGGPVPSYHLVGPVFFGAGE